jgi:hypothetical protein
MSRLVGALSSTTTVPVGLVDLSTVAALAGTNTFSSSQTITAGGGLSVTYGINADTITLTGGITASSTTITGDAEVRGGLIIGGGGKILKHLSSSFSINFGVMASTPTCQDSAGQTLTGAALGDTLVVSADIALPSYTTLQAFVSAADIVVVRWCQMDGAPADPDGAGANYRVDVWKH